MNMLRLTIVSLSVLFAAGVSFSKAPEEPIREAELKRMKLNEAFDRHKLREKDDFVIDSSPDFLVKPNTVHFTRIM